MLQSTKRLQHEALFHIQIITGYKINTACQWFSWKPVYSRIWPRYLTPDIEKTQNGLPTIDAKIQIKSRLGAVPTLLIPYSLAAMENIWQEG